MKTFKKTFLNYSITTFLLLLIGQTGFSQNTKEWSLADCFIYGVEHNLELKMGMNNTEKEKLSYQQTQWQLAPSINGGGNGNMNFRRSTNQNNQISSGNAYSLNYGISASLILFDGLSRVNQISAMKFNLLAYNKIIEQQENTLYLDVVKLFSQTIFFKQQVNVAEEQLNLSRKEQEKIETKVSLGLLGHSSIDEIKATVSGNQFELSKLNNSLKMSLLNLMQLINLPDTIAFEITGSEFELTIPSVKEYTKEVVYQQACENLPDLKEKEYRLKYYKKLLTANQGHLLPSLSINGGYSSSFFSTDTLDNGLKTPFNNQFDNYLNPSVSISLNVPIFNKRSTGFQLKRSKIDIENAVLELEQQKKEIYHEIQNAIRQLNSSYLEYVNAADHLAFVDKSFEIYREKYSMGLINSTDFITAQNQYLQAKTNVLAAKYTWIIQEKIIRLYSGLREFQQL
jgi:outer membrane protein